MTQVKARPFREEVKPGEWQLNLHPGQSKVWLSESRWVFVQAGSQWGKTCLGPHWLDREMDSKGPGDYLAVTATFPLLQQKMLPELRLVFETGFKRFQWRASHSVFESFAKEHGAPAYRILVGSAKNPESLESGTMKAAWLDEVGQHQFTRQAWEAVLRRLNIARGRILGTTTVYEIGWYKLEIYDRWKQGDPNIEIIQGDSIDNPVFSREAYEDARMRLPRWKFNMFYRGVFEKPAGLIYDCFDENVAIIPRFRLPDTWPRYVGHDFGPANTAAVWYAQDPGTGWLYVYREYLEGGLSAYDHAQKFKKLSQGERIIKRVGGAHAEEGWRESFRAAGWPISEPREHEVEVGINLVYGWHQQGKLFVFNDMHQYIDEKLSYSRTLDEHYEPTEQISDKSSYHEMDCERYILSDMGPERAQSNERVKVIYH
mgnify:CR=1 FL=1